MGVYDSSGTDQFQCWLKPTIGDKDPNHWASSANDISGLGKAELQLQGQQVEDCYECSSHGYTGYNNRDNGDSDRKWKETVYGTNDDWWQCAQQRGPGTDLHGLLAVRRSELARLHGVPGAAGVPAQGHRPLDEGVRGPAD